MHLLVRRCSELMLDLLHKQHALSVSINAVIQAEVDKDVRLIPVAAFEPLLFALTNTTLRSQCFYLSVEILELLKVV